MPHKPNSKAIYLSLILFAILSNIRAHAQDDIYMVIGSGMTLPEIYPQSIKPNRTIGIGKIKNTLRAELLVDALATDDSVHNMQLTLLSLQGYYDFFDTDKITIYLTMGVGLSSLQNIDFNTVTGRGKNPAKIYGIGCHIRIAENVKIRVEGKYIDTDHIIGQYLNYSPYTLKRSCANLGLVIDL